MQRPYLDIRQHVSEPEISEPSERLPPHLELHRLYGGRAQDAPVPLMLFVSVFVFFLSPDDGGEGGKDNTVENVASHRRSLKGRH